MWYTDESMAGEDSQDSVSLQLTISPTPKRDVLSGLQFAEAEVLSKNFEVSRVSTIYRTQRRSFYLIMECRKTRGLDRTCGDQALGVEWREYLYS